MSISKVQAQTLNMLGYTYSRLFFPWPTECGSFPILFVWQRHCFNYWRAWTRYGRLFIDNIKHCISKSSL